jgi:energy-coupling factor transporter ATP-binding protein EcfA2
VNNLINSKYKQVALLKENEITRVKSVNIHNFRGIKKLKEPLNTNADVILITGPNGFGKTSLIDALSLVLTGYLHPRRDPILFALPEEDNPPEKGWIEAVLLYPQKTEKKIKVSVFNNKPPECSDIIWPESDSAKEVSSKASFFYQDLVEQSFDNFTEGTTLKDLLAPPPKQIDEARSALRKALKSVEQKEKTLVIPGIDSEEAINKKREKIASVFVELWQQLTTAIDNSYIKLPAPLPVIDIMKVRGGFKKDWDKKLIRFSFDLGKSLKIDDVKEENVMSSLRQLENLIDDLKFSYLIPKSDLAERINYLITSLPDAKKILKLRELGVLKEGYLTLEKNLANSKKRIESLLKLENHFKSPEGPSLLEIMHSLRRYGSKWSNFNTIRAYENDICPPEEIVKWVVAAYSSLNVDNKKQLDDVLARWLENVENKRSKLAMDIAIQEKEFAEYSTTLKILEEIQEIADISDEGRELVKEAQKKAEHSIASTLDTELSNITTGQETHPIKLIENIKRALNEWINIEERELFRQDALKKSIKYKKAEEQIRLLKNALNRETKKGDSVLESVLQLPENEPQKLVELINSILPRFRLVQGVLPVDIKSSQKGTGINKKGTWEFVTADGRTFTSLSTGQQSQLAISMLLGLNISLDISYLGHGIIALDDTTTSFDMAQLPREAVLLRQIAYGTGGSNESRRQLFIVSHHEDLTHKLIDHLIPPKGKKMHVLNFVDWSPIDGPEIEQYEMEPAKSAQKGREEFAGFLNNVLRKD